MKRFLRLVYLVRYGQAALVVGFLLVISRSVAPTKSELYERAKEEWCPQIAGKVTVKKFNRSLFGLIKDEHYKEDIYITGNVLVKVMEVGDSVYKHSNTIYGTVIHGDSTWYVPFVDRDSTCLWYIDSLERKTGYKVLCSSMLQYWNGSIAGIVEGPLGPEKTKDDGPWSEEKRASTKSLFIRTGTTFIFIDRNFWHNTLRSEVQPGDYVYKEAGAIEGRIARGDISWAVPFIDEDCPCRQLTEKMP